MKNCLIVVDYQNDFVCGSLGFPKAARLENKITEKIKKYHKNGDDVIFTLDTHNKDYLKSREGRYLPVEHCIQETNGHNLYGKVNANRLPSDKYFNKSAFGSDELYNYLKSTPYAHIELVGVVTNICVISNAVLAKTAQPETDISVDASCVASNDEILNDAALKVMNSMQIEITNSKGSELNE